MPVTVLFADVVAFTKLAENREPEETVALLNELFTVATEILQRRGGIVDKFIGDCVMAVWGAPHSYPDDAERAVAAAEDLRRWLDTANRRWKTKYGVQVQLGMGIHTGLAVAGNLGSEKRMEYTVIGDPVNEAARLCDLAKSTHDRLLASATVVSGAAQAEASRWRLGNTVTLRGRPSHTRLASPFGDGPSRRGLEFVLRLINRR